MEKQRFYNGEMFDAYNYLGAHLKDNYVQFMTYAPNASNVSVVGEFNQWEEEFMEQDDQSGFYTFTSDTAKVGQMYKYKIYNQNGECTEHSDPYGFGTELRPGCCSIIRDLSEYKFQDSKWMDSRSNITKSPVNIYEMHLGSWKKKNEDEWYQYDELADVLIPYLKNNNYTHVEFMPLGEHSLDSSCGYESTGFFAPTSRYGSATQLKFLIDKLHNSGIGAIMNFNPVHFATDNYGLQSYDGTSIYEYPYEDIRKSPCGNYNFNHSRNEVQSFLQSSANYWLNEYHFDGLRFNFIDNLIYWQGDEQRGVNNNAVSFLKKMNSTLKALHPTAILITNCSSSFEGVTKHIDEDGLGFDFNTNSEWSSNLLDYFKTAPELRIRDYHILTSSLQGFNHDKSLLELSHNEIVDTNSTILQQIYGEYEDKFAQARSLFMYMIMHPGKKLNFMGNEIGHFRTWDENREQDWNLLEYPMHDEFNKYMIELNRIYTKQDALHHDNSYFTDCNQDDKCVYVIARKGNNTTLVSLMNFSDSEQDYTINLEDKGRCQLLLHTDHECWGGNTVKGKENRKVVKTDDSQQLQVSIPKYSGMLFSVKKQVAKSTKSTTASKATKSTTKKASTKSTSKKKSKLK